MRNVNDTNKIITINIDDSRIKSIFIWSLLIILALIDLSYVGLYGNNIPFYDEFLVIDILSGDRQFDLAWLWEPRNDHRIPVPRMILIALYALSGWDFRAGMYFNIFLLAATAAMLVHGAARIRGRQEYADSFFPIILLNLGHYENLLWSWQVTQVIPVAILLYLLVVIARAGTRLNRSMIVGSGLAVAMLPLCGIPGLAYAPMLSLWLAISGWRRWAAGSGGGRLDAVLAWGFAAVALLLVPLYFAGLTTSVGARPGLRALVEAMLAFIAHGLGPVAPAFQPISYRAVGFVLLASLAPLLAALRAPESGTRSDAWAMLLFGAAAAGLALAVGVARPGEIFPARYFVQAVPAWCWIYFVWDKFARADVAKIAKAGLALSVVAGFALNSKAGLDYARMRHGALQAFEKDVRDGKPPSELIARHQRTLMPFPEDGGAYLHDRLAVWMGVLHDNRIGVFARLRPDHGVREVPAAPFRMPDARSRTDGKPTRIWVLDSAPVVQGIRVRRPGSPSARSATLPRMVLWWRRSENEDFSLDRRFLHWFGPELDATFWVYDRIHEVRVEFDDPERGIVAPEITLLLPEHGS